MIVVIIAGGSGTRLWPLSTSDKPKHLLSINGDDLSLLQHTYQRASQLTDKIYVASEASHIDHVKSQLPDLAEDRFIIEPARRGTAHCILAALIRAGQANPENEPIVFMAADHYIRDHLGFVHSFKQAAEMSEKYQRMVLIGIEPDAPVTGFGYIQKGEVVDEDALVCNVGAFKEKPDHDMAMEYLRSGQYLWNAGYFVGSIEVFKQVMQANAPELMDAYTRLSQAASPEEFTEIYLSLHSIAIDYALIEKVPNLLVMPASFDWMDLGSFSDLHKAVGGDEQGNYTHGQVLIDSVENSFVHNHEDKPVAVIGVDNVAVINTPHGVLVVRKDLAQKVGEVGKKLQG